MKTIGVTGSNGFIASWVISELRKRGYMVKGLQRHIGNVSKGFDLDNIYVGDMRDKEVVERFVSQCDGVIHLAGLLGTKETVDNPFPAVETNIYGGLNVLAAARVWNVPTVIITVGNYWMNNPYSITKSTIERFAQMYAKEHGTPVNVVRGLNVFGPGQRIAPVKKITPTFIMKALRNEPIPVYGDGSQLMDMIYVEDMANILVDTLENTSKDNKGFLVEAGTGKGYTVKEQAELIIKMTGSKSEIEYLPMRPGEDPKNNDVIAKDPVKYDYTSLEDGLMPTIEYYKRFV